MPYKAVSAPYAEVLYILIYYIICCLLLLTAVVTALCNGTT